jgi:hypothetical protein
MAYWLDDAHAAITGVEDFAGYLQKGLAAINGNPNLAAIVKAVPALAKFSLRLGQLLPVVGTVLTVADLAVEDWPAIAALGVAVHFAPADAKTGGVNGKDADWFKD